MEKGWGGEWEVKGKGEWDKGGWGVEAGWGGGGQGGVEVGRVRGRGRGREGEGKRGRLISQLAVKPTKGQSATYGFPPHQPTQEDSQRRTIENDETDPEGRHSSLFPISRKC